VVSTNTTRFIKYSLIIILSIGLYFTWLQKDKFEANSLNLKEKTQKLKQEIQTLKDNLDKVYSKKTNQPVNAKQTIEIVLPEDKKEYENIIQEVNYKDLDFRKIDDKQTDDIKIIPNITLDENQEINKVEVQIQTKF